MTVAREHGDRPARRWVTLQRAPAVVWAVAVAVLLWVAPVVAVVLALVWAGSALARRDSAGVRARTRSWLSVALLTVAVFLGLSVVWAIVLLSATVGGECQYEEVSCSRAGEFLSDYGVFGFVPLLLIALGIALRIARRT